MMRRPEFLMMPTPRRAAPRRPAPPQKSGPIGPYYTTRAKMFAVCAWTQIAVKDTNISLSGKLCLSRLGQHRRVSLDQGAPGPTGIGCPQGR
jgi:hypothetical protein